MVVCAGLAAEIVGYSRNTLMSHPEWVSGKRLLSQPTVGTAQALTTRNLLAGDRLHLDAWHGFNELLYNGKADRLAATVKLWPGSWLALEYNRDARGYCAVRLGERSLWVEVTPEGKFTRQVPLPVTLTEGWHRVELKGKTLRVDAREYPLPTGVEAGVVGFRSGMKRTEVTDVNLGSFRNWRYFGLRFALVALVLGAVAWRWRKPYPFYLLALALVLYLGFDRLFWSYRYPYVNHLPWTYAKDLGLEPLERVRAGVFGYADAPWTGCMPGAELVGFGPISLGKVAFPTADRYGLTLITPQGASFPSDTPIPATGRRVMLLGTSQTRGSGAARETDALAYRLQARIGEEVIGAGVSGSNSTELAERYRTTLAAWKPDLLVVNLGNNDSDPEVLRRNLQALAGPGVVFCQEANSSEATGRLPFLAQKHEQMRGLGCPVIDLHAHLTEMRDTGFLWWDLVHLTSYGQDAAADYLTRRLTVSL